MEKINFQNGVTPVNADTFNTFQNNIEKSAVIVSKNEPTTNEKVWIQKGKNLVNKINYGHYFSTGSSTPQFANNVQFASTDFIEIIQNVDYIFSHQLGSAWGDIACFDSNYNYIEKINNQAITTKFNITNENVKYIIINMYDSNGITETNESWAQLEQNSIATPYEAYIEPKIYVKNDNGIYEEFIRKENNLEIYTQVERKIGCWINGKTLYRKVINVPISIFNSAGPTSFQYNHDIDNLEYCIEMRAFWYKSGSRRTRQFPTKYYGSDVWTGQINVNNTYIIFEVGESVISDIKDSTILYVVLEYTKTTD